MSTQPTTYQDLLDTQERLVQQGAVKAQTAANRASTLRAFLKLNKLEPSDAVGHELRVSFNAQCRTFAEHLAERGRAPRSITNTLAALRPWRKVLVALDTERAVAGDNLRPFNQAFRSLLKDLPVKRLGRQLNIPSGMLYGWLKGKKPHLSNLAHVRRVETFFGVQSGELSLLAGLSAEGLRVPDTVGVSVGIAYREKLAAQCSQHYLFKPGLESPLRTQWNDFVRYKTDWQPTLVRTNTAVWRKAPFEFLAESELTWYRYLDGVEVPSAKMAWSQAASYLGWLALPKAEGGAAVPADSLHTLAWLAVKPHVEAYVRWMVKRRGGKFNGTVFEFFAHAMAMLRTGTGYLYQQPALMSSLPAAFHSNWEEMCRQTFALVQTLCIRHRKSRQQTRDPKEPIRHILELDNPLEPVADLVQRLRADRPLGLSPWREAVWARDLALIKLLVSNPLRLRNLATLTWNDENTGQLYKRVDGSWWVRIASENFKNAEGAAADQPYDMPVQEAVWSDLERYLTVFRPRLLAGSSEFVFVAARHRPRRGGVHAPWTELSGRVVELTRKYLWRCPGVGTHAFRHLVATAIIKVSKLSDFKTAALVLNDRLSTVEKNYAHLRSADAANRLSDLLGPTFRRM